MKKKESHEEHRAPNQISPASHAKIIYSKVTNLKEPATFSAKFLPSTAHHPTHALGDSCATPLASSLSRNTNTLPSRRGPTPPPDFWMTHQQVNRCRRHGPVASWSDVPGGNWRCSSRDHTVVRTAERELCASDKTCHLNRCLQYSRRNFFARSCVRTVRR